MVPEKYPFHGAKMEVEIPEVLKLKGHFQLIICRRFETTSLLSDIRQ